jgi:hypothetical protein
MNKRTGLIAAASLVLLASLVVGGENRRQLAQLAPVHPAVNPSPAPTPPPRASEELDVEKLHRAKRGEPIVDVFAHKAVAAPLPAVLREVAPPPPAPPPPAEPAVSAPPPPPAPPALPFRFVGKFVENGTTRLLLANGDKEHNVSGGETLEGSYRVDSISEQAVTFTYLPMSAPQVLALTPPSEASR